jgi:spore coat protein U-like protein
MIKIKTINKGKGKIFALKLTVATNLLNLFIAPLLFLPQISNAGTSTASPKATATLASSCTISAQNISFGNLVLPVSAQTASSSMSVLCNNKASYTIGLAYGGIYGAGTNGNYWKEIGCRGVDGACYSYGSWWDEYNSAGTKISSQELNWQQGQIPSGVILPQGFNISSIDLNGAGGLINNVTLQVSATYGYGKMLGVAHGDSIGYFISVPGNSANVWNTNNYTYTATGSGVAQSIPLNAKLVPAQSSSSYPSPDSYMDTVTATISY